MSKENNNKKLKNVISVAILLGGLFTGSLFVDLGQILRGSGFSAKNLNQSDIFEANGKTWVAYTEPAVSVKVITDDSCEKCDPSEALVWMRRVLPTMGTQKINYASEEGRALIEKFEIATLPAFIFDKNIAQTDFFAQAQILFDSKDEQFVLKTQDLGLVPGKYLKTPEIKESDVVFGEIDSKIKIIMFSDFQCPFCKAFWDLFRKSMKEYEGRAVFVYKHFPLGIHPEANDAALASECANEQGKFWEYGDVLYASQKDWSNQNGNLNKFKEYARNLRLDAVKFSQCLENKNYQKTIDANTEEASAFGISGTPATFINSQFINGMVGENDLKAMIDEELEK